MAYFLSFVEGLAALGLTIIAINYGFRLLDRWSKGFRKLAAFILVLPPVLFLADYAARGLTLGKLGDGMTSVITILILLIVGGFFKIKHEFQQIDELQDIADALGLKFHRILKVDPTLGDHPVLKKGFSPTVAHALVGRYQDVDTLMFNFGWEDISGDVPDSYARTAVVFTDPDMEVPEFELRSAGLGHRMFGALFSGHDIELPEDPEFSKKFRLKGPDPLAVRELFDRVDRRALEETKRTWAVGGLSHRVVIYADAMMDEEVRPELEDISNYLKETWTLFESIRRVSSSAWR